MARKKAPKKKSRSGRKMSGVFPKKYEGDATLALGLVGGMVLARTLPAIFAKVAPGTNPKVINGIQAAIGVVGAVSTARMPLMRGVSLGIAAMGLMDLATNVGMLPSANAVGAEEVVINLDGVSGQGYATRQVAGGIGKSFNNQSYAAHRIAGTLESAGIYV